MARRLLLAVIALGLAIAVALVVSSRRDDAPDGHGDPTGWVKVERVTDGDTIVVAVAAGPVRVRLVQIDAPEVGSECYGEQARDEARRLLPRGAQVQLIRDPALDDTDQYGRLLRYVVRRDGVDVNVRLVTDGAAAPYFFGGARGAHARELEDTARAARAAGRGLWHACPGTPLAPTSGVATGPP